MSKSSKDSAHDSVGRVSSIEIKDFKSYRGTHIIGPFREFTAVIGPNGSGKSNIMDALSFVCGVKTSHLRASLKELLYSNKGSDDPQDHPRSGHVSLIFSKDNGDSLRFTRAVVSSGSVESSSYTSRYSIDDIVVSYEAYIQSLLELGINTRAQNFLVFQGDIEKVVQKSPVELTQFFELVSGSASLQEEYNALQLAFEQAGTKTATLDVKKRNLLSRKKILKDAKDEAERYQQKTKDKKEVLILKFLLQLFYIQADYCSATRQRASIDDEISQLRLQSQNARTAPKIEQTIAKNKKERTQMIRRIDKLKRERDSKNPEIMKRKELLIRRNRENQKCEKEIATFNEKKTAVEDELNLCRTKLPELEREIVDIETSSQDVQGVSLTPEFQQEYRDLKVKADAETYDLQKQFNKAKDLADSAEGSMAVLREQVQQMEKQEHVLIQQLKKAEQGIQEHSAAEKVQKKVLADLRQKLTTEQGQQREQDTERDRLQKELDRIVERLQHISSNNQNTAKEQRAAQAVEHMKRQFSGDVHGKLSNICEVKSDKHKLAISVLMGRHMDSVVVSTVQVAQQCIQLLKDEKHEPMEFIPLDTVKVPMISEHMRQQGSDAFLAIDLIQFDRSVEKAFIYAIGNSLVAETQSAAKRIGFSMKCKVAALDGTLIAVNGSMSGGYNRSMADRTRKFNQAAEDSLKADGTRIKQRIEDLADEHQMFLDIRALKRSIEEAQMEVNTRTAALEVAHSQAESRKAALTKVSLLLKQKEPELEEAVTKNQELQSQSHELEKRINSIRDNIFAEFSKKAGVDNIREHESNVAEALNKREKKLSAKKRSLCEMKAEHDRLENSLSDIATKLERLNSQRQSIEEAIVEAEAARQTCDDVTSVLDKDIKKHEEELEQLRQKIEELDKESRRVRDEEGVLEDELTKLSQKRKQQSLAMDRCKTSASNVLHDAMQDCVALPELQTQETTHEDIDMPAEFLYDFDTVPAEMKAAEGNARKQNIDKLSADAAKMSKSLEDVAPNFHAPEEFENLLAEENNLKEEILSAKAERKEAEKHFLELKERRTAIFNEAFQHVSANIDQVYKDITKSSANPTGGGANLNKVQEDEPFNAGINFSAIPPGKRYREMKDLSGGERTLAALALLLAIHSFKPSPFFVFDEVDAALDATNLDRVARYVRTCTRPDHATPVQGIVISLKDKFYENADALIGVTKSTSKDASAVFTFDLSKFDDPVLV